MSCDRSAAEDGECLKEQDKCQNCSPDFYTTKILYVLKFSIKSYRVDMRFRLSGSETVRNEVIKAQNVIMENDEDEVVKLFSPYTLTTSLNYFCCLNDEV